MSVIYDEGMGAPYYAHECPHGECRFVGHRMVEREGEAPFGADIYACDTGHGTALVVRWTSRECDAEITDDRGLMAWAYERLSMLLDDMTVRMTLLIEHGEQGLDNPKEGA